MSPAVLHGFRELLRGQSVQHIIPSQPGAAGLEDSVTDFFHVGGVVGVGVDDDFHALLFGLAEVDVVQIEAVGVGI